jgi:hypothetical protein
MPMRTSPIPTYRRILRLRIQLLEVSPVVWRRIEISADATFWALHVALQNAMGWTDSHLHDFEIPNADGGEPVWIGMPNVDGDDFREIRADFDERLDSWIHAAGERLFYNYDYGDDWRHEVVVEAVEPAGTRTRYPRCLAGERACPPEDVGGPGGYETFLEAWRDPEHDEHESWRRWVGPKFDPERFDPTKVRFENPARRLREVYDLV